MPLLSLHPTPRVFYFFYFHPPAPQTLWLEQSSAAGAAHRKTRRPSTWQRLALNASTACTQPQEFFIFFIFTHQHHRHCGWSRAARREQRTGRRDDPLLGNDAARILLLSTRQQPASAARECRKLDLFSQKSWLYSL